MLTKDIPICATILVHLLWNKCLRPHPSNHASQEDNVLLEMNRLNVDIMGIAETFYDGVNEFEASLITTNDKFRIIYSGSEKNEEALHL